MKSQIAILTTVALVLNVSLAFAEDIKPADGSGAVTGDQTTASKIIGNGLMPDGRECIVGTTPDCVAKDGQMASKIIGNGVMSDGRECMVGTTADCVAKAHTLASK